MSPELRPIAERLLQARVDGKLNGGEDFHKIMLEMKVEKFDLKEMTEFCLELVPCNIGNIAIEVAQKYGLNVKI